MRQALHKLINEYRLFMAQKCLGLALALAPKDHPEGLTMVTGIGTTIEAMIAVWQTTKNAPDQ